MKKFKLGQLVVTDPATHETGTVIGIGDFSEPARLPYLVRTTGRERYGWYHENELAPA